MTNHIPFRIIGLHVDSFFLTDHKFQIEIPVEVLTSYDFGVNIDEHLVVARHSYTYLQEGTKLLQMTLISTFDVKPDAFQSMLQENKFTLEPFFSQYLSTINVGAARGEIHARCQAAESELADIILPPINLTEALPEPIVITLES